MPAVSKKLKIGIYTCELCGTNRTGQLDMDNQQNMAQSCRQEAHKGVQSYSMFGNFVMPNKANPIHLFVRYGSDLRGKQNVIKVKPK